MKRALTVRNLYNMREAQLPLTGVLAKVLGTNQEQHGVWLIYGAEKNGKTTFALKLANELSKIDRVLYVSAEQGVGLGFTQIMQHAGISVDNKQLLVIPYEGVKELGERLNKRRASNIVFIDNLLMYDDEFKKGGLADFLQKHSSKLLIFIAHEARNGEPFKPAAQQCKKRANAIIRVRGLVAEVGGRCPGGNILINKAGAALVLGEQVANNNTL